MINAAQFRLLSVQAVAFTPSAGDRFRTSTVLASVLPGFATRFDGEVDAVPSSPSRERISLPLGAITEIGFRIGGPSVTLNSQNEQWKFEATPARTDSHFVAKSEDDWRKSIDGLVSECLAPLLVFPGETIDSQVGRLALVVRRWLPSDDPASTLTKAFCRRDLVNELSPHSPLRHSHSFRMDNLKKFASPIGGKIVNSWVRCSTGTVEGQASILVEQDINTLSEAANATAFNPMEIREFFSWTPHELNKILNLYFPTSEQACTNS